MLPQFFASLQPHTDQCGNRRSVIIKPLIFITLFLSLFVMTTQGSQAAPNEPSGQSNLGDFVWYDTNSDGIKDAGEVGINGVVINLYQDGLTGNQDGILQADEFITTTVTANNPSSPETISNDGYYNFDVTAGDGIVYIVEVAPSNFSPTGTLANHTYTGNNASNPHNGLEDRVIPLPGIIATHVDADFSYVMHSIGNYVWLDTDNSGHVNGAEQPVPTGVLLELLDGTGQPINDPISSLPITTTTDSSGYYLFKGLAAGDYQVRVAASNFQVGGLLYGYGHSTGANQEATPNSDGDQNDNGLDGSTPAIQGITSASISLSVELTGEAPTASGTAGDDGQGTPDNNSNLTLDFGIVPPMAGINIVKTAGSAIDGATHIISSSMSVTYTYVISNSGDTYLTSIVITDDAGTAGDTSDDVTLTSVQCMGLAGPLAPNTSVTCATSMSIMTNTTNIAMTTGSPTDSGGVSIPGLSNPTDTDDAVVAMQDALGSIGDTIWEDTNSSGGDQTTQGSEPGLAGVVVQLEQPNGTIITTTTNITGSYLFENLPLGTYTVTVVTSTLPLGYSTMPTYDPDGGADSTSVVTLTDTSPATLNNREQDFSYTPPPASIDIIKTAGSAADGTTYTISSTMPVTYTYLVSNTGQTYLSSIVITDDAGTPITTTDDLVLTSGDCGGLAGPLAPGSSVTCSAVFTISANTTNIATVSGNPTDSSGVDMPGLSNPTDSDDAVVELPSTTPLGSIGDTIWSDTNNSGGDQTSQGSEPGLTGVVVQLEQPSGAVITTTTSITGFYLFEDLPLGTYTVTVLTATLPPSYPITPTYDADGGFDSTSVLTLTTTSTATLHNRDQDFSYIPPMAGIQIIKTAGNAADGVTYVISSTTPVTYTYLVSNTGETFLSSIVITDDAGTLTTTADDRVLTSSDCIGLAGPLAPGGAVTCSAVFTVSINTTNVAMVSGDPTDSNGVDIPGLPNPTDSDDALVSLLGLGSIGDLVWIDANNDGVRDPGEQGIPNIVLTLTRPDGSTITTTTDINGIYLFSGLPAGTYTVTVDTASLPANMVQTYDLDNVLDHSSGPIVLGTGQDRVDVDFGYNSTVVSIGDRVWYDTDQDGQQSVGESGVPTVTVVLYDGNGTAASNIISTTTTDANGYYLFTTNMSGTPLLADDYQIGFDLNTLPSSYTVTEQNAMTNTVDFTDSDADPDTGLTDVFTVPAGSDLSWDMGIYQPPASIGDYVWFDTDRDGIQDVGESGVPSVTVTLFQADGTQVGLPMQTDATGHYSFTDLTPGDYYVQFSGLPSGYMLSDADQGSDDSMDSDADPITSQTSPTTLSAGENDPSWDAGIHMPVSSLGNFVWNDLNQDGVQDPGEPGLSDILITLYDISGTVVATTTTDANGGYTFTGLEAGDYTLEFEPPSGFDFSPINATDSANDSDVDPATGQTVTITLAPGQDDPTWDVGMYTELASIGDTVWHDLNRDGIQDPGEPGVEGITVTLYDGAGNDIGTTTTDTDGHYIFEDLLPGDYSVGFSNLPTDYIFTDSDVGSDDSLDSDVDTSTGLTIPTTLTPGENDMSWDAGIYSPLASIGDMVWVDLNGDGIQDAGEPGMIDVVVTLYAPDGTEVMTTTTNADGTYLFVDVEPGDYYIGFSNLPAGYTFTDPDIGDDANDSDANSSTGLTDVFTIGAGESDLTWDAGLLEPPSLASLGDLVWDDLDRDGIQDEDEPGVPGVTVTLLDEDGNVVSTTTTDADGLYSFTGLEPITYTVQFTDLPIDYVFSPADQGADDEVDSDVDPGTGQTAPILLSPGQNDLTWDAGIHQPLASLGDYIWNDINQDGIQNTGEPGLEGVIVTIFDIDNTEIATTTTDVNGNYGFNDLVPGDYYVTISNLPIGYQFSPQNAGEDDSVDSDVDPATGQTPIITLDAGENDPTWDAGAFAPLASVGDYVWFDINGDGVQDDDEEPIAGVTVNLYNTDDELIATTTTDSAGVYWFTDLDSGEYYIQVAPPLGFVLTQPDQGVNDVDDSDVNYITGNTPVFSITPGVNAGFWDAGLTIPASIGDFVWFDQDQSGIQEEGEEGIAGVVVNLYNENNELVATTTTGADGSFDFENLTPGNYYVEFTAPPGFEVPESAQSELNSLTPGESGTLESGAVALTTNPTSIQLLSFMAESQPNGTVYIQWVTAEEIDTYGFYLYRSTSSNFKEAVRVNQDVITSQTLHGGANTAPYTYVYTDDSVLPQLSYTYWLVEMELDASTHTYGPATTQTESSQVDPSVNGFNFFLPMVQR